MEEIQVAPSVLETLPYDDSIPYEDQSLPAGSGPDTDSEPIRPSLADRIGHTKVYLLSDSVTSKLGKSVYSPVVSNGKRKHEVENEVQEDAVAGFEDIDMEEDTSLRQNAILLHGSPISNLPTSNIFAYSSHFDAHPIALEWIDDSTCVLVFESKTFAAAAYRRLHKSTEEEPSMDGSVTSKPIPVALWPPEQRINGSLGKGEGLRGTIRMRWARKDDVKERGARNKSQFYKKHGNTAGKDGLEEIDVPTNKRRRRDEQNDAVVKAQLDDDMDAFLAEDDTPPSPPSKMRSAHMDASGRSLLERTSVIRLHPPKQRTLAGLPRRSRESGGSNRIGRGRGNVRPVDRPRKSQQELDDELDAFLNEKD